MISIRTPEEIVGMRKSAALLVKTFEAVEESLRPGISSLALDGIAEKAIRAGGGTPAFKGYNGYPASICVSIDDAVVHGIPGPDVLEEGQIVSIDIGVERNGFFSDAAKTYAMGAVGPAKRKLMSATYRALRAGLSQCRAGNRLSDISHAVQVLVEDEGFSVVRELVGHGIGRAMHEEPQIPNFGPPHRGPKLTAGMVLAIEPMVNLGGEAIRILSDGWTVVTGDGKPSAHFEHTVLVTDGEPDVLTLGIDDNRLGE